MKRLLSAIAATGIAAGSLDILAAFANAYFQAGSGPQRVLQSVASGAFGKESFDGGWTTALAGLAFHYLIATWWTLVYFTAYQRLALLRKNVWISGVFYGIFVWICMNLIVIPLSQIGRFPIPFKPQMLIGVGILIVCIGIPIAFSASRNQDSPATGEDH